MPVFGPGLNRAALSAFHVSIDPDTDCGDRLGSSGAGTKEEMVPVEGLDWNQFFELLDEWNRDLEALDAPELKGPEVGL